MNAGSRRQLGDKHCALTVIVLIRHDESEMSFLAAVEIMTELSGLQLLRFPLLAQLSQHDVSHAIVAVEANPNYTSPGTRGVL